jgi:hypothetical protein
LGERGAAIIEGKAVRSAILVFLKMGRKEVLY